MTADRPPGGPKPKDGTSRLDQLIAATRRNRAEREKGYRAQSLKIHPWVCARCGREFNRSNLHLLTVHHKDHDHGHNPPDGSNWENLCIYCHENEHRRCLDHLDGAGAEVGDDPGRLSHTPFAALADLLAAKKSPS